MKSKADRKKLTPPQEKWIKETKWVVAYIEQLRNSPSAHGLKWTVKMIRHYTTRFDHMYDCAPRGCKNQANEYRTRVKTVAAWAERTV